MDSLSDYVEQAYKDDVRLGVKDPGMKCVLPEVQQRIVAILENIKVLATPVHQDDFGAPEGGWPTPVMERVREVAGIQI